MSEMRIPPGAYGPEPEATPVPLVGRHLQPVPTGETEKPVETVIAEKRSPLVLDTGVEPDTQELANYALGHDSAALLLETMKSVHLIKPEKQETRESVQSADISIRSLQAMRTLPISKAQELIEQAHQTYRTQYLDDDTGRVKSSMAGKLADATEKYNESSLLNTLAQLRSNVSVRKKSGRQEITIFEAERIARIMVLQEQERR